MQPRRFRYATVALKFCIGLALLGFLFRSVDTTQIINIVNRIDSGLAVVSILAMLLVICYQAVLMVVIARPVAAIPLRAAIATTFVGGFFSQFLPSSVGGDVVKGYFLAH